MGDSTLQPVQAPVRNWRTLAACRGLDPVLFFPERGEDAGPAKAVCATCPVTAQCLEFAIGIGETEGIWGGLSGRQMRKHRRVTGAERANAAQCGTLGGYHAHRRRGQEACHACKAALAAHRRATRAIRAKREATDAA